MVNYSEIKEHTSSTIAEFKKKCEKKMKDMKDRYKEDIENKDTVISDLRAELVEKNDSFEKETEKLKEMVGFLLLYFVAIIFGLHGKVN